MVVYVFQVCCSGHGKNGALCVLQQSIRPEVITQVRASFCVSFHFFPWLRISIAYFICLFFVDNMLWFFFGLFSRFFLFINSMCLLSWRYLYFKIKWRPHHIPQVTLGHVFLLNFISLPPEQDYFCGLHIC